MLPFPTYQIPEEASDQTATMNQWLLLAVRIPYSDDSKTLLEKISTALQADFATNTFVLKVDPEQLISLSDMNGLQPKLIISFGVSPEQLGIWLDMTSYGMCILESYTLIYTLPADQLNTNATAKKELWRMMQEYLERSKS